MTIDLQHGGDVHPSPKSYTQGKASQEAIAAPDAETNPNTKLDSSQKASSKNKASTYDKIVSPLVKMITLSLLLEIVTTKDLELE